MKWCFIVMGFRGFSLPSTSRKCCSNFSFFLYVLEILNKLCYCIFHIFLDLNENKWRQFHFSYILKNDFFDLGRRTTKNEYLVFYVEKKMNWKSLIDRLLLKVKNSVKIMRIWWCFFNVNDLFFPVKNTFKKMFNFQKPTLLNLAIWVSHEAFYKKIFWNNIFLL